ncbi:peptidyl-tRNA hydrolase, PTH1 family [Chryseobacterium soldanellicola]|uniref:Peptidyl-tRNA hydrolase, PTH1 family n=1 Tax=Chryseobacterium soldanellicola TaxID=311333 RepID=A0A1H1G6A5_9FLAO|nr:putative quinol monooxygenase [Chryseobacterium soldanellicola]SDR08448.1 peptidyl-tRNA hydrolase, PTH1 family [Chryseobacterium soldanellicola]
MDQKAVYVYAKWQVKEGKLDAVLQLMKEAAEKSSQEEGNLFYKLHQSRSNSNTLILFEGYKDATAIDTHRNSEHFKSIVLEQVVPLLENREVIVMDRLL